MTKCIAVLGANGRSGREFVLAALAAGYTVRAGVHGGSIEPKKGLNVIDCDATNQADLPRLLNGADFVVSLIGHVPGSPKEVQTNAIKTIIQAMRTKNLTRIVSLTGTGVRFPGDRPSLIDRLANFSIKIIDPNRVKDGISHAKVLQSSQLNWTIVRVLKLTNGPASELRLTSGGPAKQLTSRAEVAQAILRILEDPEFYQKAPVISK